jgi:hypothetical protein
MVVTKVWSHGPGPVRITGRWRGDQRDLLRLQELPNALRAAFLAQATLFDAAEPLAYELAEQEWRSSPAEPTASTPPPHRDALNAGGLTVVVLACDVEKPYRFS